MESIGRGRDQASIPVNRRSARDVGFGALLPLQAGPAGAAPHSIDEYILQVDYSERELGPFRPRTRTYNSSLPGPPWVMRPGHMLRVKLTNNLPANLPASAPAGIDPLNNPHAFNTTNLHVHGLQVIPHLFKPLGSNPEPAFTAT